MGRALDPVRVGRGLSRLMVRGLDPVRVGRGLLPVCAALGLAGVVAPGCSRSGLDDYLVLRLETTPGSEAGIGPSSPDAPPGDDAEADAASSGSRGDEGGEFFTQDDSSDDAPGSDGGPVLGADGGPLCSPANCLGCCTASGSCLPGGEIYACGAGGQRCAYCGPERGCTLGVGCG